MKYLPKAKSDGEVTYRREDGRVVSELTYPCGCQWVVVWVRSGLMHEARVDWFCEEHDPTTDKHGEVIEF